jgi:Peptidase A4 family
MSWVGRARVLACGIVGIAALVAAGSASAAAGAQTGTEHHWPGKPLTGLHRINNDTVTSTNWSGYAVESGSGKFTDVTATWVQPKATCNSSSAQYASFWAGIDGYNSSSVEQTGSDSDCRGTNRPSYYAWYEMYPAASVQLSTTKYPVSPGDTLTSEVSVNGTSFTLKLSSSRNWTFTTTQTGSGLSQSSAEVIAESPESCFGSFYCWLDPLANFGTIQFNNVQAALNGGADQAFGNFTSNNGPHEIVATTSNGTVKAQPSALSGTSFSDTWKHT